MNEGEVWDRFAAVVALAVDASTIHERLEQRNDHSFGNSPQERLNVVSRLRVHAENFRSYGAIVIDASRALDDVLSTILAATAEHEPDGTGA